MVRNKLFAKRLIGKKKKERIRAIWLVFIMRELSFIGIVIITLFKNLNFLESEVSAIIKRLLRQIYFDIRICYSHIYSINLPLIHYRCN